MKIFFQLLKLWKHPGLYYYVDDNYNFAAFSGFSIHATINKKYEWTALLWSELPEEYCNNRPLLINFIIRRTSLWKKKKLLYYLDDSPESAESRISGVLSVPWGKFFAISSTYFSSMFFSSSESTYRVGIPLTINRN